MIEHLQGVVTWFDN